MRIFIIAGEASGDKLGAALMGGLKKLTDARFDGVGGPLMQAHGLTSRFPMDELSVMGLTEILPKYAALKARVNEMITVILHEQPDILITIDSPDFSHRVAAGVKAKSNIRCVHYVAPTVWAWRPGRARKIANKIDQLLALFPFEPPYFTQHGLRCDFVGHPVVNDVIAPAGEAEVWKKEHGPGPMILALPGSRAGEIARLSERFGQALAAVQQSHPGLRVVLPVAPGRMDQVRAAVRGWATPPILIEPDDPHRALAFRAADVALAASGTVSLELAANGTPMVIAYDMAPISRFLISRMLKTDTVTLVNLVSDTRVVPEFIGNACQPGLIASALRSVLVDPTAQYEAMQVTMDRLGQYDEAPGLRAARAILDGFRSEKDAT